MADDSDTTKQSPDSRSGDPGIRELARALLMTDTSVTRYGVDLVLDGRIEYPGTVSMSVESEERAGCVTA